jgi:acetolactate synthase I/II/III large subunit
VRRKPGCPGVTTQLEDPIRRNATRTVGSVYGGDLRLTGKPGVCLSTLGPGALNFSTGAAYALLGAMPMILITGQKGILSSKQARFQIVDVVSSMTPLTENKRVLVDELRKRVPAAIA